MIRLRRIIRGLAALICLGAALALFARSGLPDKVESSAGLGANRSGAALEIGSLAPPFQLLNVSGEEVAIAPGVITLINFWATYCAPCRQELSDLQQLQSNRPDSLRVLAINLAEPADQVADWQRQLGLSIDLLLDPALAVSKQYLVRGIPTMYLIDSAQRIRNVYYGPVKRGQLDSDIRRLAQRA